MKHEERLSTISPQLASVVRGAAPMLAFELLVVEGKRTLARQKELYAQGRTAPGNIVTWTLQSKHIDGLAVDLAPLKADGSIDWANLKAFDQINDAMQESAKVVGVRIRWGADWNQNGKPRERGESDSPHWELA